MIDPAKADMVLHNFKIATMASSNVEFNCGISGKPIPRSVQHVDYGYLENVSLGVRDGKFQWIALDGEIPDFDSLENVVDATEVYGDLLLTPGLIDCHTHLVYGGNRADEWEMRLNGKGYEEIARAGGGILSTVRATRAATEEELFETSSHRLKRLIAEGVTTIEIKSGYGLDVETELKMLRVANRLGQEFPVTVEPTMLGAHAVPPEFTGRADEYLKIVCDEMIPQSQGLCTAVDAFCESIAFDLEQTKRVFEAAIKAGLNVKVHAEQLSSSGAAAMASEMGALSADHLEYLTTEACQAMAENGTVATLLPGAFYCLKEKQKPPVAALREHNVPIAIATDSNPGSSPVTSLLLMGNMACNLFDMTPAEALAGMTTNAALALGLRDTIGSIEIGKQADFVAWDVASPAELFYEIGNNPCVAVFKSGKPNPI